MNEWISVKDKLPEAGQDVEVVIENTGGGFTTYEESYDVLTKLDNGELQWLDGDGKFGRTTILWRED